nr:hypothetical protein [Tanacetum cinerariifolium]
HINYILTTPATAKNQGTRTCYECGGVLQMSILLTSKKALEQVKRLHAMNVGIKGTTREIVRSERTKAIKTKSKVLRHEEWCMPLEEEKTEQDLDNIEDEIEA